MAQKLRQIVSTLALDLKALNIDDRLSFRYLADKFRDKIAYYLRLEARSRELIRDISIWKPIKCIELIDVATNDCGYTDCKTLKRSKNKIPEAYNTNYGLLIKILIADGSRSLTPIKSSEYTNYTHMQYGGKNTYFWFEDGYIFIPDTDIQSVKGLIIAKNPIEVDNLNNPCGCVFPLDGEVNYSDYLITLARKEIISELFQSKQIVQDERGNDNTNSKN